MYQLPQYIKTGYSLLYYNTSWCYYCYFCLYCGHLFKVEDMCCPNYYSHFCVESTGKNKNYYIISSSDCIYWTSLWSESPQRIHKFFGFFEVINSDIFQLFPGGYIGTMRIRIIISSLWPFALIIMLYLVILIHSLIAKNFRHKQKLQTAEDKRCELSTESHINLDIDDNQRIIS